MTKTVTHKDNLPYFGDEPLLEIAPNRSFAEMIFELLSGKKPDSHEAKLFETILNISIDHGPDTPSAVETIKTAKEGKTISEAVSAGTLQINDTHGGAIEPAMETFYKVKSQKLEVKSFVQEQLEQGKRIAGFGHRIYEIDPRSQLLFRLAEEGGITDEYIEIAKEIERELKEAKGKVLPVNIDGAIAAVLCAFGWGPKLGKAVFIIARTPGLAAHYIENSK
ncbi:MAG: Citrate synthase [Candidatus Woesebacteria bacterium GW2011_GWB1_45_5]|uniref:citrate synthase (unknown stereospecificity) n=1 Tax=Candidatus Woesebacteria bacterium GW2011_GWB1_45_5 TaxID=1618581 RepID=A0A0G1PUP4_9BACT|nr:MAG: Citrate synthase [Candidatus Woesebacteria bacterium GW2011_GWB1_45_5]